MCLHRFNPQQMSPTTAFKGMILASVTEGVIGEYLFICLDADELRDHAGRFMGFILSCFKGDAAKKEHNNAYEYNNQVSYNLTRNHLSASHSVGTTCVFSCRTQIQESGKRFISTES